MPQLTIQLDLTDEAAAPFKGRDVVVAIPATQAEYSAFFEHGTRIHEGLELLNKAVDALIFLDPVADAALRSEGHQRLTALVNQMRASKKVMETFIARHVATLVMAHKTGETLQ